MATRDLLTLDNSIAPRLIRWLYCIALVLIAVMVVLGVARGVRTMLRPPMAPIAMNGPPPGMMAPSAGQQSMMPRGERRMMMMRQGMGRRDAMGPGGMFGMGRNPILAGGFTILFALLRGLIVLFVVRILAEVGLAVLAMPRRSEA